MKPGNDLGRAGLRLFAEYMSRTRREARLVVQARRGRTNPPTATSFTLYTQSGPETGVGVRRSSVVNARAACSDPLACAAIGADSVGDSASSR